MSVFVVIPFYKNTEELESCKSALAAQIQHVLIVSEDINGDGFTKNANQGIVQAVTHPDFDFGTGLVVLLNQDCQMEPGSLAALVKFMDEHPKAGLVSVKQLAKDRDFITHGGTKEAFPAGRHEGGYKGRGDCNKSKKVPWANFACVCIRGQTILHCGLLDESMRMFGSDSDFSYTARARGWECWYCAEAEVIHEGGASLSESNQRDMRYDMTKWRDKWVGAEVYKDLSLEVFR
jgi:N-acetylglucosaminyl-diphospho-decaprenol L-rhamnosyltransferase